jgi:peptidoglycan/xylan/chitin deacetylase (PgdA/CDA1 family)
MALLEASINEPMTNSFKVRPLVLMYHGVPRHAVTQALDSHAFERHMLFMKSRCTFLRPEELATARGSLSRPAVLLTFDDGFQSNAEVVAPLLRRHGIPAVFFITSRHAIPQKFLWFTYLKLLLAFYPGDGVKLNRHYISLDGDQRRAGVRNLAQRLVALRPHPSAMYEAIDSDLPPLQSFVPPAVLASEAQGMNAEQVKEIGAHPLFSIGGHTIDHPYLTYCASREAKRQIVENKEWLEGITGRKCRFFAYPGGEYNQDILDHCRALGFERSFAVNPPMCGDDPLQIRRIGIYSRSVTPLAVKLWSGHWFPLSAIARMRASFAPGMAPLDLTRKPGPGNISAE